MFGKNFAEVCIFSPDSTNKLANFVDERHIWRQDVSIKNENFYESRRDEGIWTLLIQKARLANSPISLPRMLTSCIHSKRIKNKLLHIHTLLHTFVPEELLTKLFKQFLQIVRVSKITFFDLN
jgi:hypothetical protein